VRKRGFHRGRTISKDVIMIAKECGPKLPESIAKTQDSIKEILKKYEFKPEFYPNIKRLFSKENSIHQLKLLRQR
jgi:hypothetical protein